MHPDAAIVGLGRTSSSGDGGPTLWGESHDATADPRRARQLTSQASRAASRYVVFRSPSFNPSPSRRALGRNLALDLVAAVGLGVSMGLVMALLPTIARRGGLEPLGLSALAAAPFVANLLSAFAGRFGPRSSARLALIRGDPAETIVARWQPALAKFQRRREVYLLYR